MTRIRQATAADYAAIMDRCAVSFSEGNPGHPRFQDLFPDSVRPTAASVGQWLVAEDGAGIVAGMQVVPRPMVVAGGIHLPASGLGNVFCYPPCRNRGHMSALLKASVAWMARRGDAINILGGDRLRYGRYGWENAGSCRSLSLGSNMMRGEEASRVSVVELRRWQGDRADTTRMLAAYNRLPYRTRRSAAEFARVLRRPGQVVWLCDHATDGFGYVSVTGGSQLAEYAGDPLAVNRLVRYLVSRRGVQVTIPPAEAQTELESILLSYAAGFTVVPVGMIRVVSLKRTLVSYARCLARRLAGWRGAFCLSVDGGEAVVCRGTGRRLLIETAGAVQGEERLGLGTQDLARLLFGPFPPALGAALDHEFLRRAFPLPIYLHALSHV